jgi:hypothetical protein
MMKAVGVVALVRLELRGWRQQAEVTVVRVLRQAFQAQASLMRVAAAVAVTIRL